MGENAFFRDVNLVPVDHKAGAAKRLDVPGVGGGQ